MTDWTAIPWTEHQDYERDWHGTCANTFSEEAKQITYAAHMGLVNSPDPDSGRWPQYDLQGKSVLDIGGGPTSLLLKCVNVGEAVVVDPCPYPGWVTTRYEDQGIRHIKVNGENYRSNRTFDEVWIYNVLQHVEDPVRVLETARLHGARLRIFEWIDLPPCLGHPHMITKALLDDFLKVYGNVAWVDENGCVGKTYFGTYTL